MSGSKRRGGRSSTPSKATKEEEEAPASKETTNVLFMESIYGAVLKTRTSVSHIA